MRELSKRKDKLYSAVEADKAHNRESKLVHAIDTDKVSEIKQMEGGYNGGSNGERKGNSSFSSSGDQQSESIQEIPEARKASR